MTKRQAENATPTPEQLTLLAVSDLPVQFRLDQRTRQRGLAHIAAIRRQLAAKSSGTAVASNDYDGHHQAA